MLQVSDPSAAALGAAHGFQSSRFNNVGFQSPATDFSTAIRLSCLSKPAASKMQILKETLDQIEQLGVQQLDHATCASLLRQCGDAKALAQGKRLHAHILRGGSSSGDTFIGNMLVYMYGKCGSLDDSRNVFDNIRQRNVFSWTIMTAAYAQNGQLQEARMIFDAMPKAIRNVVSWNSMIAAYAQSGHWKDALELFRLMDSEGVHPDEVTLIICIDACSNVGALEQGKIIHGAIDNSLLWDVKVGTAIVDMYGKCGQLQEARDVFDRMPHRNVVSWNAMIAAYANKGQGKAAIQLFQLMSLEGVKPDNGNFVSVLDACASVGAVAEGMAVHSCLVEAGYHSDLLVGTALVNMYNKLGQLQQAKTVFHGIQRPDVVLWTALLQAYAQNGHGKEAFRIFQNMDLEGFKVDEVCFISVLDACASAAAIAEGRLVHASLVENGIKSELQVGNAIVHMYGQCGYLEEARSIFEGTTRRDAVSWSGMVAAYAQNGHVEETVELFLGMALEGIQATPITFISVLSACSHAGKLLDGLHYFGCMQSDYGVQPLRDHYMCVIDLLGRLGQLEEAEYLTDGMPAEFATMGWMALLSACKVHGNLKLSARAAEEVLKLDPENSAPYVLLSNAVKDE